MTTIISGTPRTDIYVNQNNGICILQKNNDFYKEDPYVYFDVNDADKIINAIKECVKEIKVVENE